MSEFYSAKTELPEAHALKRAGCSDILPQNPSYIPCKRMKSEFYIEKRRKYQMERILENRLA
ncbi:hypothetical protein ABNQ39_29745 [Azospirillum sp. A26]|uniref:hypothetical protein n=1 Tax=Azospirillum sp. A26 TaxID=3160607 RepID=UPI00366ECE95